MVASVSTYNSSFTETVGGCGEGCEICVRAISCEGEGEEACVTVKNDQCSELTITWCVVDILQ